MVNYIILAALLVSSAVFGFFVCHLLWSRRITRGTFFYSGNLFWIVSRTGTPKEERFRIAREMHDYSIPNEAMIRINERDAISGRLRRLTKNQDVARNSDEAAAIVRAAEVVRWLATDQQESELVDSAGSSRYKIGFNEYDSLDKNKDPS